jgi:hypothetical protein
MKRLLKSKSKDQDYFVKLEKTRSAYAFFIRLTSSGIYQKSYTTVYIGSRGYVKGNYRIPRSNEMFQLSLGIVKGGIHG